MAKKEILFEYNFTKFIEQSVEHGFNADELGEIENIISTIGVDNFRLLNAPGGVDGNKIVYAQNWSTNTIAELDSLFREFVEKSKTIYLYFINRQTTKVGDDDSYVKVRVCLGVL